MNTKNEYSNNQKKGEGYEFQTNKTSWYSITSHRYT